MYIQTNDQPDLFYRNLTATTVIIYTINYAQHDLEGGKTYPTTLKTKKLRNEPEIKNKAVYTTAPVAGGWAGAVMSWAGAEMIWAGA